MKTLESIIEPVFPITSGIVGIGWHQIGYEQQQEVLNAMKEAQIEILEELERRWDADFSDRDMWDFINELQEELK